VTKHQVAQALILLQALENRHSKTTKHDRDKPNVKSEALSGGHGHAEIRLTLQCLSQPHNQNSGMAAGSLW
jgi:hypothetical protein